MSLMAMKKRALTLTSSHAGLDGVFSLHGKTPHPSRSMGRLLYPTSMKGLDPRGYGGGRECRLSGRFARICGSSLAYPPIIHQTCETVETVVKHAVMNYSGKKAKDLLCCANIVHRPPVKKKCTSHAMDGVDKEQKPCGPFFKEIGAVSYDARLRKLTEKCIDVTDPKYHQC